jgi:hypothetical protein
MASTYPAAPKVIIPEPGVNPLRTLADWRDLLHRVTFGLVPLLVSHAVITAQFGALWVPLVLQAIDPLFSAYNAVEKARRIIYVVGFIASTALATYGWLDEQTAALIGGAAVTVLTSWIASKFTVDGTLTAA